MDQRESETSLSDLDLAKNSDLGVRTSWRQPLPDLPICRGHFSSRAGGSRASGLAREVNRLARRAKLAAGRALRDGYAPHPAFALFALGRREHARLFGRGRVARSALPAERNGADVD